MVQGARIVEIVEKVSPELQGPGWFLLRMVQGVRIVEEVLPEFVRPDWLRMIDAEHAGDVLCQP